MPACCRSWMNLLGLPLRVRGKPAGVAAHPG